MLNEMNEPLLNPGIMRRPLTATHHHRLVLVATVFGLLWFLVPIFSSSVQRTILQNSHLLQFWQPVIGFAEKWFIGVALITSVSAVISQSLFPALVRPPHASDEKSDADLRPEPASLREKLGFFIFFYVFRPTGYAAIFLFIGLLSSWSPHARALKNVQSFGDRAHTRATVAADPIANIDEKLPRATSQARRQSTEADHQRA